MPFDFDAAVAAPFRMQPGLRRRAASQAQLVPLPPGSVHQREKLAVLSAFWPQALCATPGFDARPALDALCAQAAAEHPDAWHWDGRHADARIQGVRVAVDGHIEQAAPVGFGGADDITRCLHVLPADWRLAGLISLSFAQDFAIIEAAAGRVPWMAVALPSHWAPEHKVGRHFTEIHEPVADSARLLQAGDALMRLVGGPERWERFVWTVTDHPRLHAHPERVDPQRWLQAAVDRAWFRTEHQSFIPLPTLGQAIFTIHVELQPLSAAIAAPARAAALHAAVATMSPAVLRYRGLAEVREALLAWLAEGAAGDAAAATATDATPAS